MVTQKKSDGKIRKKRKSKRPREYGFPNVFLNRNVVSRSNLIWQVDGTFLNTTLNNQIGTKHYLLSAVDPATNRLVFTKIFYSGSKGNTFSTDSFIKLLDVVIKNEKITEELMLHTDRGSQFTSKKYTEYVNSHPLLIGSQTAGGQPNQNPIIERMHHTFKNQLKDLKMDLPTNVKRRRDLQIFCDKRKNKMNTTALYTKNNGLTVVESCKQLEESNVIEPEVLLARECDIWSTEEKEEAKQIKEYKKNVRYSALVRPTGEAPRL